MKCIQVSHHYAPCIGGIETYIQDMARALGKNKVESEVLCLDTCPNSGKKLKPVEKIKGIKVTRVPYCNAKYYKIAPALLEQVKNSDADVIHIHQVGFLTDYLCLTKKIHKKPIVVSTHGGIFHTKNLAGLKKIYFGGWCKRVLKNADYLIADSGHDYELFKPIAEKIKVIENGIDFERFSQLKGKRKKNQIISIGRVAKNKRVDNLIEAVGEAKKLGANPRIVIAGTDPEKRAKKLEELAKEKGVEAVFMINASQQELEKSMAESTFFASASGYEAFGIAAVEGMASGLVPILNNIKSYSTFLRKKKSGFVTDFSNAQEAGKTIAEALSMNKKKIVQYSKNAQSAAKQYDWKEKAKEVKKIYQEAIRCESC